MNSAPKSAPLFQSIRQRTVKAEIKKLGRQAVVVKADVGEDGEIAEALRLATGVLGPLTGVVASAGILEPTPIASATTAQWDHGCCHVWMAPFVQGIS